MENNSFSESTASENQKYDSSITSTDKYIEAAPNVHLYVRDYGTGKPVILIHGWPLSNEMWEYQIEDLVNSGFRVIAYDRRGFGRSSQPWNGYDYDTLTDDLSVVISDLKLTDVTLVGFSMGGGEAVRYFSRYGGEGVSKLVLISSVIPFLLQTENNPEGMPQEDVKKMADQIREDRMDFLTTFGKQFYGVGILNHPVSNAFLENDHLLAAKASPRATLEAAASFSSTDFRNEMDAIKVPTLIIHGDSDATVPIKISSDKTARLISHAQYIVYEGAPHGLFYTERKRLNSDLLAFLHL